MLSLASPVFKDMFEMPQGEGNSSILEPIPVAEPSAILHSILLILYPSTTTKIKTYDEGFALLAAYDKYDMDIEPLRPVIREFLRRELFVPAYETHYALAWLAGLREETQKAVRQLHQANITSDRLKDDIYKRTGKDPRAHTALLELRLQRQIGIHGLIEKLPFDLYFCPSHSPTISEVGKLRDLVNTEMNKPAPDAVRLLKSLSQLFPATSAPPMASTGWGNPLAVGASAQGTSTQCAKAQPPSSGRTCSGAGCWTQLTAKTEAEIYDIVQRVATAMGAFPQTIEW